MSLFSMESLQPVASILDEKGIQFIRKDNHVTPTVSKSGDSAAAAVQFITEFLGVSPVDLEANKEVAG